MLAAWLFATASAGCGVARERETQTVRGVLVDVAAPSLTNLRSFDLRTDDGRRLSFRVEGDVGMTPAHLREHMVLGEPVSVTYRESADGLLALRLDG